jgi:ABC-type transporter Mla subunit MlaD
MRRALTIGSIALTVALLGGATLLFRDAARTDRQATQLAPRTDAIERETEAVQVAADELVHAANTDNRSAGELDEAVDGVDAALAAIATTSTELRHRVSDVTTVLNELAPRYPTGTGSTTEVAQRIDPVITEQRELLEQLDARLEEFAQARRAVEEATR